MYEGGCISPVFHFKMVKNYVIFVLTAEVGAEHPGNASDWLVWKPVPQRTAGAFGAVSKACLLNISPASFLPYLDPCPLFGALFF